MCVFCSVGFQVCALLDVSFVASSGVKVVVATTKRFAHFEKDLKPFWKVPALVRLTICLHSPHLRPHPRGAHSETFSHRFLSHLDRGKSFLELWVTTFLPD